MKYRKGLLSAVLGALCLAALAAGTTPQEKYVAKFSALAVNEMYRTGVPASITLAQGLLESRYGLSELVEKGNNHFGIKCNGWTGRKVYHDDDHRGECFRAYDSSEQSFRDHSDFLRTRDRYKFLFDYKPTDYKAWAYGLKKAGYATDPAYPAKLIKLIEDYKLYQYDTMTLIQAQAQKGTEAAIVVPAAAEGSDAVPPKSKKAARREAKKAAREERRLSKKARHSGSVVAAPTGAVSPSQAVSSEAAVSDIEAPDAASVPDEAISVSDDSATQTPAPKAAPRETISFSLSRELCSRNGVPFIYAVEGETLSAIAAANDLTYREILRFNDLSQGQELSTGDIVYIAAKKTKAAKGQSRYVVQSSEETLWSISQQFGVKVDALSKLNGFSPARELYEGQVIKLR